MVTITLLSSAMALGLSIVVWRMVRDDRRRSEARVAGSAAFAVRLPIDPPAAPTPSAPSSPPASVWDTRAPVVVCVALALTTVVLMLLGAQATTPVTVPVEATAAGSPARLDLLSLRGAREGGTLTIAGLVGNPSGSATLRHVRVAADAFGSSGARVASGATELDVRSLAPGDESPFVVSITTSGPVARYRVSFFTADGRVIRHVDRRGQAAGPSSW